MKIVVSRADRAGDLILSTPMFREIRTSFPQARIIAHVRKYTASILRLCPWIDEVIVDEDFPTILALSKKLSLLAPERIIIAHPSRKIISAAFLARIPIRTGRASNLWQFMLNDRRVQKRSRNEMHEFQYNLHLLDGIAGNIDFSPPVFCVPEIEFESGHAFLQKAGMENCSPIVIHPGHGGSAHNISLQQYVQLAKSLIEKEFPVLVSIGPGEEKLKDSFPEAQKGRLGFLTGVPDFAKLAGALSHCAAFISGSTGPMHLAAALKLPVVAFFPPVPAMTPVRWGPVCHKNLVILPKVSTCKANCERCHHRGCMETISMDSAIQWLERTLRDESASTN